MSTLTFSDVDQILRIVDQFPAAEVRFEHGDLKLHIRRTGATANAAPSSIAATSPAASAPPAAAVQAPVESAAGPAKPKVAGADRSGQVSIESPLMGVYYAAPAPGAEPFVRAGQKIAKGADLCIIEVMKVMNNIRAPFGGVVVDVVAENGTMIEKGQPLIWLREERAA